MSVNSFSVRVLNTHTVFSQNSRISTAFGTKKSISAAVPMRNNPHNCLFWILTPFEGANEVHCKFHVSLQKLILKIYDLFQIGRSNLLNNHDLLAATPTYRQKCVEECNNSIFKCTYSGKLLPL